MVFISAHRCRAAYQCRVCMFKHDIIKSQGEGFHSKKQNKTKKMNKRNTCGTLQRCSCHLQKDKHIKQNHCVPLSPIYNFFFLLFFKFSFLTRTPYRLALVMCFSETNFFLGDTVHSSLSHIHFFPLIQSLTWYGKVKHWSAVVTVGGYFQAVSMLKPKAMKFIDSRSTTEFPGLCMQTLRLLLTHTQHIRSPTALLCFTSMKKTSSLFLLIEWWEKMEGKILSCKDFRYQYTVILTKRKTFNVLRM